MKAIQSQHYKCDICGAVFDTEQQARKCESRPVTQDRGVKVGDVVTVLSGDGAGKKARVDSIRIADCAWGHYAWDRYWHTPVLSAKLLGEWGSRTLTFDAYSAPHPPRGADSDESNTAR